MAIDYSRRKQVRKGVTKGQYEAITEAMRLIVEEDRERGIDSLSEFVCAACARPRTMVGSVEYDGIRLCNDCATAFEVARVDHTAGSCAEFVSARTAGRN